MNTADKVGTPNSWFTSPSEGLNVDSHFLPTYETDPYCCSFLADSILDHLNTIMLSLITILFYFIYLFFFCISSCTILVQKLVWMEIDVLCLGAQIIGFLVLSFLTSIQHNHQYSLFHAFI